MPASRTKKKKTPDMPEIVEVHEVEDTDKYEDLMKGAEPELSQNINSSISNKLEVVPKVYHNDFLYRVGDIVSLREKNTTYYAQIRTILEDMFSEKYVAVIWLLPTSNEDNSNKDFDQFDPSRFTYGPQDEWFYNLNDVSFVMHPPNKFYKRFISPVPRDSDFIFRHVIKHRFKPTAKRKS